MGKIELIMKLNKMVAEGNNISVCISKIISIIICNKIIYQLVFLKMF